MNCWYAEVSVGECLNSGVLERATGEEWHSVNLSLIKRSGNGAHNTSKDILSK